MPDYSRITVPWQKSGRRGTRAQKDSRADGLMPSKVFRVPAKYTQVSATSKVESGLIVCITLATLLANACMKVQTSHNQGQRFPIKIGSRSFGGLGQGGARNQRSS
jgi:hypothetical protein